MSWWFYEIAKFNKSSRISIRRLVGLLVMKLLIRWQEHKLRSLQPNVQAEIIHSANSGDLWLSAMKAEAADSLRQMKQYQCKLDKMWHYSLTKKKRQILLACEVRYSKLQWIAKLPPNDLANKMAVLTEIDRSEVEVIVAKDTFFIEKLKKLNNIDGFIRILIHNKYGSNDTRYREKLAALLASTNSGLVTESVKEDIAEIEEMSAIAIQYAQTA